MSRASLNEGWRIRSSAQVESAAIELSLPGRDVSQWLCADLPATALGALVDNGAYPDPFTGANLLDIPGQGPRAQSLALHEMPEDSPFRVPWLFRKEFEVPAEAGPYLRLALDGVNYRADVWLNGVQIADASQVAGAYREHEIDVTDAVDRGGPNALLVVVQPPRPCDLSINWVDWNPSPPDRNLGLWRDVWLSWSGPVALRAVHVTTRLEGTDRAHLTVGGDAVNTTNGSVRATVIASLAGKDIAAEVALSPRERRRFELETTIDEPRLWWPRHLGEPAMYDLGVEAFADGVFSDDARIAFGVREVTSEPTEEGHALLKVNGVPILIRGAGWAGDLFLRRDPARELATLEYAEAMELDAIRFEGKLERAEILEWCDRHGMLVIAGWCCCDVWEKWAEWSDETIEIAVESLRSQLRRARRHPSLVSFWYGSDFPPPPHIERAYLEVVTEERWPNSIHSSAAAKVSEVTGPSGLKMEGPYDYVPPVYWFIDERRGGAFGFATEVCAGPAVPPIESLERMITEEHRWPIDEMWNLHAGGNEFHNIDAFLTSLEARYGAVRSARELARLSQLATYETVQAMFEAYASRRFRATGVIHWMLDNAWPSLIWHLFDHYMRPGGGYFGAKAACAPIHILFDRGSREVVAVNNTLEALRGARIDARLLGPGSETLFRGCGAMDLAPNANAVALEIPNLEPTPAVSFLDLRLASADGRPIDRSFYWLPSKEDVLDWEKATWVRTPIAEHADLAPLRALPPSEIRLLSVDVPASGALCVEAHNPTQRLAFFVELRLVDAAGEDVLPALWSDNYISLLPGETRTISVRPAAGCDLDRAVKFSASGMNLTRVDLEIPERAGRRVTGSTDRGSR